MSEELLLNEEQIKACQTIGRDSVINRTCIGLTEFDALCRTALIGAESVKMVQAARTRPRGKSNAAQRLEEYNKMAALVTTFSNKILELDGANMDQAEIPLILGEFALRLKEVL